MLTGYDWVYLLSNIFSTYTIFKFMCIFFDRTEANKKIEWISYIVYYFVMDVTYIMLDNPTMNLIVNLLAFYLLTLNYQGKIKKRLMATLYVYVVLLTIESLIALALNNLNMEALIKREETRYIIGLLLIRILSYIAVLALSNYKMIKEKSDVSFMHWVAVFVVPSGTLFSTIILIAYSSENNIMVILISITILFLINIFVFYLYDALLKNYQDKFARELLQRQNNSYIKQFDLISQSQNNFRILRHDFKNHLSVLQSYLDSNKLPEAKEYVQSLFEHLDNADEFSKSGNMVIDSILNYKLGEARNKDIKIETSINIPEKLSVEAFDLSAILGNLLDNAIEACCFAKVNRQITVSLDYDKNILFITVANTFDDTKAPIGQDFKTSKKDKENHGYGLQSVRRCVEKYRGKIVFHCQTDFFIVDILLYCSE